MAKTLKKAWHIVLYRCKRRSAKLFSQVFTVSNKNNSKNRDVFSCVKTFQVKSNDAATFFFFFRFFLSVRENALLLLFEALPFNDKEIAASCHGVSRPLCMVSKEALKPRNLVLVHVVYRR